MARATATPALTGHATQEGERTGIGKATDGKSAVFVVRCRGQPALEGVPLSVTTHRVDGVTVTGSYPG